MQIRTCDINVKSLSSDGTFKGYASVFNKQDAHGDVVCHGAFLKTLVHWRLKGTFPKMLWQHNHDQVIGVWTYMIEDEKGLYVEGKLLLDVAKAREAYALLKEKAIDRMSIGYVVKRKGRAFADNKDITYLQEVDLIEVSLVTFAANEEARVLSVKSAADDWRDDCKNGRKDRWSSRDAKGHLLHRVCASMAVHDLYDFMQKL